MQTSRPAHHTTTGPWVIREAVPQDAETLHAFFGELAAERDLDLPFTPDGYPPTERILRVIETCAADDHSLYLLAWAGDQLIGELTVRGGGLQAIRHTGTLALTLHRDWRGRGLGRELIERAIAWARTTGLLRLELQVYSTNERAIRLYRSLGFVPEVCRRRAIAKNGVLVDDHVMALLFEPGEAPSARRPVPSQQPVTPSSGWQWIIREAGPDDVPALHDLSRLLAAEPDIDLPWTPEEVPGADRLLSQIEHAAHTENAIFWVACVGGQVVGKLTMQAGHVPAISHSASFGVTLHPAWRGKGLGRELVERAIDWAKAGGRISRIELQVYATNERGLRLYERLGFELEGCRRQAFRKNGTLVDEAGMALLL